MNLETRFQDFSLLVKKYAQDLQNLRNRYEHVDPNDMNFYYASITDPNSIAHIDDNKSGDDHNGHNNCERRTGENNNCDRNASKNNKSAEKRERKKTMKIRANKKNTYDQ